MLKNSERIFLHPLFLMLVFVPPEKACPVVQAFPLFVGRCPTPCQGSVFEKTPLGTLKNFFRFVKAKPDNLVGVSCRDFVPPEKAHPDGLARPLLVGRCPTPCQGSVFEKTPLGTLKNFFRFVKAKPEGLSVFRERTLSRLKRRTSLTGFPSLCGTLSHTLPRSVFEKTPLGTLKNFFRCVKAKPNNLSVFRAGTSSRLKRLSLFRSCRREASPKTQGLSEDASHHAREHKTPTEGTATGIHRPVPENQRFRHSGFFALP